VVFTDEIQRNEECSMLVLENLKRDLFFEMKAKNKEACIQLLNDFPVLLNEPLTSLGSTAFHRACFKNFLPLCYYLIEQGIDIQKKDNIHQNAIHYASYSCSVEFIKHLHGLGLSLDVPDENGRTPLLIALNWNPSFDVVAYLLEQGADINRETTVGESIFTQNHGFDYTHFLPYMDQFNEEHLKKFKAWRLKQLVEKGVSYVV